MSHKAVSLELTSDKQRFYALFAAVAVIIPTRYRHVLMETNVLNRKTYNYHVTHFVTSAPDIRALP
ncbi:MAG: YihA family ribosome biogenesis GTP-binding protein, partial [Hafnia sp.]